MNGIRICFFALISFLSITTCFAAPGQFFNVSANGLSLIITTNVPTHPQPYTAGIEIIRQSGYSLANVGRECSLYGNGLCLFNVGNNLPATISLLGESGIVDFELCLSGVARRSCQRYSVSIFTNPPLKEIIRFGYILDSILGTVSKCLVDPLGLFTDCNISASGFNNPRNLIINPAGNLVYVSNQSGNNISRCSFNTANDLTDCSIVLPLAQPFGIVFNSSGTLVYITQFGQDIVTKCLVAANGDFTNCTSSGNGLNGPTGIFINASQNFAYITNYYGNSVSKCTLLPNGDLTACTSSGSLLFTPVDLFIDSTGANIYVSNQGGATITQCALALNGDLVNCFVTGSGFGGPSGIFNYVARNQVYIANVFSNYISRCNISAYGYLEECIPTGDGLVSPIDVAIREVRPT